MAGHTGHGEAPANPLITVAICTRNRAALLEKALQSVLAQLDSDTEVLVVDNGSTDRTPQLLAECAAASPAVRAHTERAPGISAARNAALARARGEYVLFFDDDQEALPGWLAAYRRFLANPPNGKVACVGGAVLPHFEGPVPAWVDRVRFQMALSAETRRLDDSAFPGCGNCAYHRQRALEVGGFSAELRRCEETELVLRLKSAGYEVWWLAQAPIRHFIPRQRLRLGALCRLAFAEGRSVALIRLGAVEGRWWRPAYHWARLALAPVHALLQGVVALLDWPFGRRRLAVKALLRATRIAGFAWELAVRLGTGRRVSGAPRGSSAAVQAPAARFPAPVEIRAKP